jgi:aldose 1-epimerase
MKLRLLALFVAFNSVEWCRADVVEGDFGKMPDGVAIRSFTITGKTGGSIQIITYGATITFLRVPDRSGKLDDIVLGYDQLDGYLRKSPYFGAIVGRYANRIAGSKFTLDGVEYKVTPTDRLSTLHGGRKGFDKVVWTGAKIDDHSVEFTYLSKDGEEGFPGNLTARARYTFSDSNELKIEYTATTDKPTVCNLTSHSYFNLAGAGSGDVLGHELTLDADHYTPIVRGGIPTGQIAPVEGTPFDFRQSHKIGERIDADDEQLKLGNGYDHNWALNKKDGLRLAATLSEPTTGRTMEIWTTEPGIQFYTGNGLDGTITGKDGKVYARRSGLCLEPHHYPDSPNRPEFPSTVLRLGETYRTQSIYKFGAK